MVPITLKMLTESKIFSCQDKYKKVKREFGEGEFTVADLLKRISGFSLGDLAYVKEVLPDCFTIQYRKAALEYLKAFTYLVPHILMNEFIEKLSDETYDLSKDTKLLENVQNLYNILSGHESGMVMQMCMSILTLGNSEEDDFNILLYCFQLGLRINKETNLVESKIHKDLILKYLVQ